MVGCYLKTIEKYPFQCGIWGALKHQGIADVEVVHDQLGIGRLFVPYDQISTFVSMAKELVQQAPIEFRKSSGTFHSSVLQLKLLKTLKTSVFVNINQQIYSLLLPLLSQLYSYYNYITNKES